MVGCQEVLIVAVQRFEQDLDKKKLPLENSDFLVRRVNVEHLEHLIEMSEELV